MRAEPCQSKLCYNMPIKVEKLGLGAADAKTVKCTKHTMTRSHEMFTYLHLYAFVFVHKAQLLESPRPIKKAPCQ